MAGPIVFRTPKDRKNRQNNNNFKNSNYKNNMYNYNRYNNNYINKNNYNNEDKIDEELQIRIWEEGVIEVLGLETVYNICLQAVRGQRQLPRYISYYDCLSVFSEWAMTHEPPFSCEWGHNPLMCVGCVRHCLPREQCMLCGHRR